MIMFGGNKNRISSTSVSGFFATIIHFRFLGDSDSLFLLSSLLSLFSSLVLSLLQVQAGKDTLYIEYDKGVEWDTSDNH